MHNVQIKFSVTNHQGISTLVLSLFIVIAIQMIVILSTLYVLDKDDR